jgi:hypothetical protein
MLARIIAQMHRKGFFESANALAQKWTTLNLYEKKRAYRNWHLEWPPASLLA